MKERRTKWERHMKRRKKKKIGLTTKIFIALLAGAVFGIIFCYAVPSGHIKDDIIVEGVLYVWSDRDLSV